MLLQADVDPLFDRCQQSFQRASSQADSSRTTWAAAYNLVSDDIAGSLSLTTRSGFGEWAWPGRIRTFEQQITGAVIAVLTLPEEYSHLALAIQTAVLAGCSPQTRAFYAPRRMRVLPLRGGIAPDIVLDGSEHTRRPPGVPSVLVVEVKYTAGWQCPKAEWLSILRPDFGYDRDTLFATGHGHLDGPRVAHAWGLDCEGTWHTSTGGDLWLTTVMQLDAYLAYGRHVLRHHRHPDLADASDLRLGGVLLDAWNRPVTAEVCFTHADWATSGFDRVLITAAVLYAEYGPGPGGCLEVLLDWMLYL